MKPSSKSSSAALAAANLLVLTTGRAFTDAQATEIPVAPALHNPNH